MKNHKEYTNGYKDGYINGFKDSIRAVLWDLRDRGLINAEYVERVIMEYKDSQKND